MCRSLCSPSSLSSSSCGSSTSSPYSDSSCSQSVFSCRSSSRGDYDEEDEDKLDEPSLPEGGSIGALTAIAQHRRLGPKSLQQLKKNVLAHAKEHTFKETSKKFGVHHSTVSGWVKSQMNEEDGARRLRESQTGKHGDLQRSRNAQQQQQQGDEMFIDWLRRCREEKHEEYEDVTADGVKEKVGQIIKELGVTEIEKTCNWFLLWSKRYIMGYTSNYIKYCSGFATFAYTQINITFSNHIQKGSYFSIPFPYIQARGEAIFRGHGG